MGAVRMMRTSSLSMRTFRPIAVGILGSEFEQRRLVAELYLLSGLIHMHDLVDDLEQRLAVLNLAVMHFLWLAPAAIKQNLGRHNPRHRRGGVSHYKRDRAFIVASSVCCLADAWMSWLFLCFFYSFLFMYSFN